MDVRENESRIRTRRFDFVPFFFCARHDVVKRNTRAEMLCESVRCRSVDLQAARRRSRQNKIRLRWHNMPEEGTSISFSSVGDFKTRAAGSGAYLRRRLQKRFSKGAAEMGAHVQTNTKFATPGTGKSVSHIDSVRLSISRGRFCAG